MRASTHGCLRRNAERQRARTVLLEEERYSRPFDVSQCVRTTPLAVELMLTPPRDRAPSEPTSSTPARASDRDEQVRCRPVASIGRVKMVVSAVRIPDRRFPPRRSPQRSRAVSRPRVVSNTWNSQSPRPCSVTSCVPSPWTPSAAESDLATTTFIVAGSPTGSTRYWPVSTGACLTVAVTIASTERGAAADASPFPPTIPITFGARQPEHRAQRGCIPGHRRGA